MSVFHMLAKGGALKDLSGADLELSVLTDKVILFVNVASRCGLTPQYEGLVRLQKVLEKHDFTVIGVPCNQFGLQEPGTPEEIKNFCDTRYKVNFPLLKKQDVNGPDRSPLYDWLVESEAGGGNDIEWNFGKFIVSKEGQVIHRFAPAVRPNDQHLISAIRSALQ